jgi:hypothetical protein
VRQGSTERRERFDPKCHANARLITPYLKPYAKPRKERQQHAHDDMAAARALAAQPCGISRGCHTHAIIKSHQRPAAAAVVAVRRSGGGSTSTMGWGRAERHVADDGGGRCSSARWSPPASSEEDEVDDSPIDLDADEAVPSSMPSGVCALRAPRKIVATTKPKRFCCLFRSTHSFKQYPHNHTHNRRRLRAGPRG